MNVVILCVLMLADMRALAEADKPEQPLFRGVVVPCNRPVSRDFPVC